MEISIAGTAAQCIKKTETFARTAVNREGRIGILKGFRRLNENIYSNIGRYYSADICGMWYSKGADYGWRWYGEQLLLNIRGRSKGNDGH